MKRKEAKAFRDQIDHAAQAQSDADALRTPEIYCTYDRLMGTSADIGYRFMDGGLLWKTAQPRYTFDGLHRPGEPGTEALFTRVTLPEEGTDAQHPVEYRGSMELHEGKYYTQDGVVYRCTRDSGVPLYNSLAELVGIYAEMI